MKIELVSLDRSACYVAGEDGRAFLQSRELSAASFLKYQSVPKEDFLMAMSRLRGMPEGHVYHILVWSESEEERWALEMLAEVNKENSHDA